MGKIPRVDSSNNNNNNNNNNINKSVVLAGVVYVNWTQRDGHH